MLIIMLIYEGGDGDIHWAVTCYCVFVAAVVYPAGYLVYRLYYYYYAVYYLALSRWWMFGVENKKKKKRGLAQG